jgi:Fe-S-cluster-containing dehydrogenase component/CRP-like cAMP-binding protein
VTADVLLTINRSTQMEPKQIAEILREVPFLTKVPQPRRLKLIESGFLRSFEPGEKIVREGEHGHSMFVLVSGSVSVQAITSTGATIDLAVLAKPGSYFGEGAILGRTRRSASISSVDKAVVLELEKIVIEKLDNMEEGVLKKLEQTFERRSVETFLTQHTGFGPLTQQEQKVLAEDASLESVARGESIFKEGDRANTILVIKAGSCQLERKTEAKISVLAYFSAGDVVGLFDGETRPGTLTALEFVEYVEIGRQIFDGVKQELDQRFTFTNPKGESVPWSAQFDKAVDAASAVVAEGSFIPHLLSDSVQQARSLLTIDLNLCIRCGNCTRACESRHGYAKMTRRGKKLVRGKEYASQPILLPSSCRHCDSPECMIGCPTGAIHRKPTGEVSIHEFCIGCSNCAIRCPWDNITMVPTPGRFVGDLATPKIASKCDLCFGYSEANCVHNCPTKAIFRVDPVAFFPEVQQALRSSDRKAFASTQRDQRLDLSRAIIWGVAAIVTAGMVVLAMSAKPYSPATMQGFWLGVCAVFFLVCSAMLGMRRRIAKFPTKPPHPDRPAKEGRGGVTQLGALYLWARAHLAIGTLALVAVGLHSRMQLGGFVTSMLLFLLTLQVLTGVAGVWFYRWWPKRVTKLERSSQVEEDVLEERSKILQRREELVLAETHRKVAADAINAAGSPLACLNAAYDPPAAEAFVLKSIAAELPRDPVLAAPLETLAKDAVRLSEIEAMRILYKIRRNWLAIHVGITAMLMTLVVVHMVTVASFYLRLL